MKRMHPIGDRPARPSRSRMLLRNLRNGLPLCMALVAFPSYAQIYKWVDEQGRTHYSEQRDAAGKARPEEVNVKQQASSAQAPASPSWKEKEREFQSRQARKSVDEANRPEESGYRPESLSKGRKDESNQGKCNLAKDIVNGSVRHRNGAPTDQYDIEVAKNDIKTYCR